MSQKSCSFSYIKSTNFQNISKRFLAAETVPGLSQQTVGAVILREDCLQRLTLNEGKVVGLHDSCKTNHMHKKYCIDNLPTLDQLNVLRLS